MQTNPMGRSQPSGDRPIPLVVLVGIPGSGKSTWAKAYVAQHPDYCLVSTDQIRASLYGDEAVQGDWRQVWRQVLTQWQRGIEQVQQGKLTGVLYDATNTRRRNRRQVIVTARTLGFNPITLVWFDVPLTVGLSRNRLRSRQVPPEVIVAMHRQLCGAAPSLAEDVDQIQRLSPDEKKSVFLKK